MERCFYFIAQTGSIMPHQVESNFYQYMIPELRKGEVLAELETAVIGSGGLEYHAKFLNDLSKWDKKARRYQGC